MGTRALIHWYLFYHFYKGDTFITCCLPFCEDGSLYSEGEPLYVTYLSFIMLDSVAPQHTCSIYNILSSPFVHLTACLKYQISGKP